MPKPASSDKFDALKAKQKLVKPSTPNKDNNSRAEKGEKLCKRLAMLSCNFFFSLF